MFATEPHMQLRRSRRQAKEAHHPEPPQHQARKKTRLLTLLRHRAPKQIHLQRLAPHLAPQQRRSSSISGEALTKAIDLAALISIAVMVETPICYPLSASAKLPPSSPVAETMEDKTARRVSPSCSDLQALPGDRLIHSALNEQPPYASQRQV
jgi:hypothetical protein